MSKEIIKKQDEAFEGELSQPMKILQKDMSTTKELLNKGVDFLGVTGSLFPASDKFVPTPYRILKNFINIGAINTFNEEIKNLQEKSKLKDFTKSKYGQQSFIDMFEFIDSANNDQDRINSVKSLFFALNHIDNNDEDDFMNYQLFKIGTKLDSLHFVILKTINEINENGGLIIYGDSIQIGYASHWFQVIAKNSIIKIPELVEKNEKELIEQGLITGRVEKMKDRINQANSRITTSGEKLVENIKKFDFTNIK